ncbi:phage tail tape measure protein [Metapseudomonas sp. CR1201]
MANTLGTLTLDLVAKIGGFTGPLDKAARESQKRMADIKKSAEVAGKAIAGIAVATAAGLAALTVNTVRTANEITRLSQVANASTEEFQRYAAGAQAVGIEQDKLADIFKDVNDKVGDFLQTGGGALADFFENVAPKVGVTADQFRKLSGPEALGLYVSSLEKAGASQADMTFYLEAIASDATALLPLLKNNAEGFRLLGESAAQAGAILDNDTIRAATELQAVSILTDQALTGLRNQIAAGMLPVLADLSGELFVVAEGTDIAKEAGQTFGGILKGLAATAFGAYAAFQAVGKSIAALAAGFGAAGVEASDLLLGPLAAPVIGAKVAKNFDAFKNALAVGFEDVGQSVEGYAKVLDGIWSAGSGEGAETEYAKRIKLIADLLEQSRARGQSAGIVIDQNTEKTQKATDAIQSQVEALQLQAATLGLTTKEETLFKLALDGATQSQLDQAAAALDAVDAFEKQKKAQEDYKGVVSELRTEEEQLTDQLKERLRIIEAMPDIPEGERRKQTERAIDAAFTNAPDFGGIDAAIGGPAGELMKIDDAQGELEDWYATQLEMLAQHREDRADLSAEWDAKELDIKRQHEEALANIEKNRQLVQLSAAESTFGSLAEMARVYAGESSGIYKALFAVEKGIAIARAAIAIQEGIALAAANPFPLNLAAMASVAAATASLVGNIASIGIEGQAHDGIMSIPEDGTWNLKKGERVTTAETSAKLDATLDRVQAGMAGGRTGGGNTYNISLPGVTNAREAREAAAAVRRGIALGVAGSGRYT